MELAFVLAAIVAVLGCIQTIAPVAPVPVDPVTPGPTDGAVSVGLVSTADWTSDVDPWAPLQPSSPEGNPADLDVAPTVEDPMAGYVYDVAPIRVSPVVPVAPADVDPSIPLPTETSDPTMFGADAVDALYPLPTPATDPDAFPTDPADLPDADPPCPFENWINP